VLLPSAAVTTTDTVLAPTARASAPVVAPLAVLLPFTRRLAPLSAAVGVSVRLDTPLATAAV
jgi:hypothetical protein